MPYDDGFNLSSTALADAPESIQLIFNPFSDAPFSAQREQSHFTSAIEPAKHQPKHRRHGSGSGSSTPDRDGGNPGRDPNISLTHNDYGRGHSRSQTEVSSSGHHPLRSVTTSLDPSSVAGITRPHLNRMLEALVDAPPVEGNEAEALADAERELTLNGTGPEEKVVLVHKILSTDSLAGVALKYGINMAELRKANHLWASDSIHVRKVLYIPLDKTSYPNELASCSASEEPIDHALPNPASSPYATLNNKPHTATITRIPASQLSFFPPSSASSSKLAPSPENDVQPLPVPHQAKHMRSTTTPSTSSASLTSLLTAFPIAASTRNTIIARLSFDSTSSASTSDEHELDDVRAQETFETPRLRYRAPNKFSSQTSPPPSPTRSRRRRASLETPAYPGARVQLVALEPQPEPQRPAIIRTVQMEPSPVMILPSTRPVRSKSRPRDVYESETEVDVR